MIGNPTIGLALSIERAQAANEQKIARDIGIPQQEISTGAALLLRHYSAWCKSRGIKSLPCTPASAAAFVRSEAVAGVSPDQIVDAVWAIEMLHDNGGYSNPCATAVVRAELGRILNLDGQPRSWPKADRLKFNSLPIEIRAVIERRERQNSAALRKIQNEFSQLRKSYNERN